MRTIRLLLATAERQLALLEIERVGARIVPTMVGFGQAEQPLKKLAQLRQQFEASPQPCLIVDPRPGLHIIDFNDSYQRVSMTSRWKVAGQRLFDVFPDNPDDPAADGLTNVFRSMMNAVETGKVQAMGVIRYDVRDETGKFVEKYWRPVNTPIFADNGNLMFLIQHVEDATAEVLWSRAASRLKIPSGG
jgi:PAS domain-containing protein